jgi:hypothetical protein
VYDVGLSIDREVCAPRLTTLNQRVRLGPKHRTPQDVAYRPAPSHIMQEAPVLTFGNDGSSTSVDMVLNEGGAVALTSQIPLRGPCLGLLALRGALDDQTVLLQTPQCSMARK